MNRILKSVALTAFVVSLGTPAFGQGISNQDDCSGAALDLRFGDGAWMYDNTGATTGAEGQMEALCYAFGTSGIDSDVWMVWVPTVSGIVTLDTCNGPQTADTKIAAYPGIGCPADGTSVACNDDTCGLRSQISFSVQCGEAYTIQLGSFPGGATGSELLTAVQAGSPCPPPNVRACITVPDSGACELHLTLCNAGVVSCPTSTGGPKPSNLSVNSSDNVTIDATWQPCIPAVVPPDTQPEICIDFSISGSSAVPCGSSWIDAAGLVKTLDPSSVSILLRQGVGSSYCGPAAVNSSGQSGTITATGSNIAAANDVTLIADNLPAGQFGYFLASQTQGFFAPPGSQGFICLAGNIGRYNAVSQVGQGECFGLALDLSSVPVNPPQPVLPGDTWNFQCWFRDNNPGQTSNFTDGLSITFQ